VPYREPALTSAIVHLMQRAERHAGMGLRCGALSASLILLMFVASATPAVGAGRPSSWSTPVSIDGRVLLTSISCASSSFCVAADGYGNAVIYKHGSWDRPTKVDSTRINSVSCPSALFCVAVDEGGNALTYNGSRWSTPDNIDSGYELTSVSCPSTSFCTAVGGTPGDAQNSNAVIYNGSSWGTPTAVYAHSFATSVSCSSASFCAAVDNGGAPTAYNGNSWSTPVTIDCSCFCGFGVCDGSYARYLNSVSCASASFCVTVDSDGNVFTYGGTLWSRPVNIGGALTLTSVSCPTTSFCAAMADTAASNSSTDALTYNGINWSAPTPVDQPYDLSSISCASPAFCVAVGSNGQAAVYHGHMAPQVGPAHSPHLLRHPVACHVPHPYSLQYNRWSVRLVVTPHSGVIATAVKLGSRFMADDMSSPYLTLWTKRHPNGLSLQLSPCGASHLAGHLRVVHRATKPGLTEFDQSYRIAVDPADPHTSHLDVTQRFIFEEEFVEGLDGRLQDCEPSGQAVVHNPSYHPCARWKLVFSYVFHAGPGDGITSLTAYERLHFRPDGKTIQGAMLAHDCEPFEIADPLGEPCVNGPGGIGRIPGLPGISIFNGDNPLQWETEAYAMRSSCCGAIGTKPGIIDNLHLTTQRSVGLPVPIPPGCLECVHIHWRWGASIGGTAYGNGDPLTGCTSDPVPCAHPGTEQDTVLALVSHNDRNYPSLTGITGLGQNPIISGAAKSYSGTSALTDPVVWFKTSAEGTTGNLFAWGGFFCAPMSAHGSRYGC